MTTQTLALSFETKRVTNPRTATLLLAVTMFFTGAAGLVNEYVLATVSTYVLGNSVEQFSMVIATMLLAMGAGSWAQRFISDDRIVEKFVFIELALSVLGAFAPTLLYGSFAYVEDHFALVQYSLIVGIGFLVGFEIPIVIRLNGRFSESLKVNIATVYGLDYLGAFVAALLWSRYLIKEFPLTETSFLVSGCNLFVAILTYAYFARCGWVKRPLVPAIAIGLSVVALAYGFHQNRDWSLHFEQKMYADPIVKAETTKYQRIVVTRNKKLDDYRLYLNGNLQFSSTDEKRYHEALIHPALSAHPNPKRVLVLGGGDGMAVREILKYPSVETVTLVDLDPRDDRIGPDGPDAFQTQCRRVFGRAGNEQGGTGNGNGKANAHRLRAYPFGFRPEQDAQAPFGTGTVRRHYRRNDGCRPFHSRNGRNRTLRRNHKRPSRPEFGRTRQALLTRVLPGRSVAAFGRRIIRGAGHFALSCEGSVSLYRTDHRFGRLENAPLP
jgi:hypothetical protein